MRSRVLAVLVAVLALQAVGCSRLCRCCRRDEDRIPPAALTEKPLPPPASTAVAAQPTNSGKLTGAYGGTGE